MKPLSIVLMICLCWQGCQEEAKTIEENSVEARKIKSSELTGHWTWESTTGSGIAGPYTRTASASSDQESFHFFAPLQVRIERKVNNEVVNEYYSYTLANVDDQTVLTLYSGEAMAQKHFVVLKDNLLVLSNFEACCDNTYESVYRKTR
jgi:hypothetical protein